MGKVILRRRIPKTITREGKKKMVRLMCDEDFEKFNPRLLSLGDIGSPSREVEAIAAVFDLSGFTDFCKQVDPHLAIPPYLSRFLDWLFNEIKQSFLQRSYKEGKRLWTDLPFLAKFLGDGVLFLWNARNMSGVAICNLIILLQEICLHYAEAFYPQIRTQIVEAPKILRCGVARGKVYSVGNGQDYVGPCINMASRLQKFSNLTFCFSHRGFDIDRDMHERVRPFFVKKRVAIRGIGEHEIVVVLKSEFVNLPDEDKAIFKEP